MPLPWALVIILAAGGVTEALRGAAEAPPNVREVYQGGVIRVDGAPAAAVVAALPFPKAKPVRLFPGADGMRHGLVPVVYNAPPGPSVLEFRDEAGEVLDKWAIVVRRSGFPVQNIRASRAMKALKATPGELEKMRALHDSVSELRRGEDMFTAPVPHCVNSPFGVTRLHNGKPSGNYHRGLDQASPAGEPIRAAASGVVRVADLFNLHGGTVGLDHGQGLTSHYLHLSKILVADGQLVKQGEVIGEVGATGFATGPHLHWGVYLFAVPVNPRVLVSGGGGGGLRSCGGDAGRGRSRKR